VVGKLKFSLFSFMKPDVMSSRSRTPKPDSARSVAPAIERNISAMVAARQEVERARGIVARVANAITGFAGRPAFLALHVIWFGGWILWNVSLSSGNAFDPFPFGTLTTIVSLEAIFLSAFVLMSQNRDARIADQRADLDVQINLLAEYEITRLLRLMRSRIDLESIRPKSPTFRIWNKTFSRMQSCKNWKQLKGTDQNRLIFQTLNATPANCCSKRVRRSRSPSL